jgi:hypothetical protein
MKILLAVKKLSIANKGDLQQSLTITATQNAI